MTSSLMLADRTTGFKMRRATLLNGSFATDLDPLAEQRIAELDKLLGKHLFQPPNMDDGEAEAEAESAVAANSHSAAMPQHVREARALLSRPFRPWRPAAEIIKKPGWPSNSMVDALADAEDDEAALSLSDHIDLMPELADLKYDFAARVEQGLLGLDANARAVMEGRSNIVDFLVARAYHIGGLRDPKALYNYIVGNREGVRAVVNYVAVGAARTLIAKQKLKVPNFHEDGSAFTLRVKAKAISLSDAGFDKAVKAIADDLMYNADANKLLDKSKIGNIPDLIKPTLIQLIKGFKIPLTAENIDVFLPSLIAQAYEYESEEALDEPVDTEEDRGYQVQFRDAADPEIDINREAVHYAAQLFHAMVIGEELGVFDAFQYLLHSRMIVGGGMEVRDKRLRADLRLYTLSNQFRDLGRPGRPQEERTRPSERKMFARMVFAQGDGQLMEGMPENTEFRQLWEVLMLESAHYLERAQESFNPGSFVSKQNVMQAVEDLQYNISTHCVGWPQVMAPAIDAELNFVLARFIQNEKIAQQVLPAGGSWKRVVDKLNAERPKKRPIPAAALLYAKATQGMQILEAVADYTPAEFEDDRAFSGFISLVDAYITTESKLQSRGGPAYRPAVRDEDDEAEEPDRLTGPGDDAAPAANDDEWDF